MAKNKLALLSLIMIVNVHAAYDEEDAIKLSTNLAYGYDSNVFRLSENQDNNTTRIHNKKSDSNIIVGVGGGVDWSISRQIFNVRANYNKTNYATFKEMNSPSWDTGIEWDWLVGSQINGVLSARTSSKLSSFDDVRVAIIDNVKTDDLNWLGNLKVNSNWFFLANAGYKKEIHNVRIYESANNINYGVGAKYQSDQGLSIVLQQNWSKHNYLEDLFIPADLRGYSEQSTNLAINWPITNKFNIDMAVGLSRWKSQFDSQKSNRPVGALNLIWQATEKTKFKAGLEQRFDEFSNIVGRNFERKLYIGTEWLVSNKSKIELLANVRKLKTVTASGLITQDSVYNTIFISYNYFFKENLYINSNLQLQKKDDKDSRFDYKDSLIGLSLKYQY